MASRLVVSHKKLKSLSGSRVKLLSPAKLNLYLNIIGTYPDGFHRVESVTEKIDICDTIDISVNAAGPNRFVCTRKDLQSDTNLCMRAADLLIKTCNLKHTFTIKLTKKIPVGAGLGGGSSNAATTLIGMSELMGLKLSQKKMYSLGAQLGSDVNLFLNESSYAFVEGRGEIVKPLAYTTNLFHCVVWPNAFVSTKDVYRIYRDGATKNLDNAKIIMYAIRQNDSALIRQTIFNALEKSALSVCAPIRQVKDLFMAHGIEMRVTGSGSALYAVVDRAIPASILQNMPKCWRVFNVRTF